MTRLSGPIRAGALSVLESNSAGRISCRGLVQPGPHLVRPFPVTSDCSRATATAKHREAQSDHLLRRSSRWRSAISIHGLLAIRIGAPWGGARTPGAGRGHCPGPQGLRGRREHHPACGSAKPLCDQAHGTGGHLLCPLLGTAREDFRVAGGSTLDRRNRHQPGGAGVRLLALVRRPGRVSSVGREDRVACHSRRVVAPNPALLSAPIAVSDTRTRCGCPVGRLMGFDSQNR
jgi:hypothetical protein